MLDLLSLLQNAPLPDKRLRTRAHLQHAPPPSAPPPGRTGSRLSALDEDELREVLTLA